MAFANFQDIYIVVGDTSPTTQVYSSATNTYVANNAAAYDTWLNAGNLGFFSDVTAKANNAGLVRLTLDASQLQTGQRWLVSNVSADANGIWTITKISATQIDLQGSTFNAGSTFPSGTLPKLQGAAIVATDALARAAINGYNIGAAVPNASTTTSSSDVTLTRPMNTYYSFLLTGAAHKVILPAMNAAGGVPIGAVFTIANASTENYIVTNTQYFGVYANDATTLIAWINPGETFQFTVLTNTTANGTFLKANIGLKTATWSVKGLKAANYTGTSTSALELSWLEAVLHDTSGSPLMYVGSTQPCDVTLAGPAVQGRDQAAAFTANSWVHFYIIGGVGLAVRTICSTAADPSSTLSGPTMPAGYTHFCYMCTVRFNGASQLPLVTVRGNLVAYTNAGTTGVALSAGAAVGGTPTTAVSVTTLVPPTADNIQVQGLVNAGAGSSQTVVGTTSGSTIANPVAASNSWAGFTAMLPNVNQNLYYNNSLAPATTYINILGYTVPNGG